LSDEAEDLPRYAFQIGAKTDAALQARGGNLYITSDSAGLPRARTAPPERGIPLTTISGDGWFVHVESTIGPAYWEVKWTRLPWPHFALRIPTDGLPTGSWVGAVLNEALDDLPLL
jgi:hypothetical protein